MKKASMLFGVSLVWLMLAGLAFADFSPTFDLTLSDTKVKGNPSLAIHLEFDEEDEEIGGFTMLVPKGFKIASDESIPGDEAIGGGSVTIQAGPACRPGPESAIPVSLPVSLDATIYEKDRTQEEIDMGVHSVWFLDLEPLNRVRLLVSGSPKKGWTVSGAPDPSDNTCNPLIVDLAIDSTSESGVPVVTNPKKPGKYAVFAHIQSQDSPSLSIHKKVFRIKK